jgi:uncharacterized protein (TIGR02145 family)
MFLITKIFTPKKETNMKTAKRFPTLAAIFAALAFTLFACSSDGGGGSSDPGASSSSEVTGVSSSSEEASSSSSTLLAVSCEAHDTATQFCDERDGKIYKKVTITIDGYSKTWMAENLNYAATDSRCYENNDSNCDTYGRLYNWATAMDNAASSDATPSGVQGVCPDGWHLPSDAEWTALTTAVGTDPGKKLKASNTLWTTNTGTDDYGFSALPGGCGVSSGSFSGVGSGGYWWSSTQSSATFAWSRLMIGSNSNVSSYKDRESYYNSVRCLQN